MRSLMKTCDERMPMRFHIHLTHGLWGGKTDLYFDSVQELEAQISNMLKNAAFDFTVRA